MLVLSVGVGACGDGPLHETATIRQTASAFPLCWSQSAGGAEIWRNASPEQFTFAATDVGEEPLSRIYIADYREAWACQARPRESVAGRGEWAPAWSPDGHQLAFLSDRNADLDSGETGPDLFVLDTFGSGGSRALGCADWNLSGPAVEGEDQWSWSTDVPSPVFSPDGTRILAGSKVSEDAAWTVVSIPVSTGCLVPDDVETLLEVPVVAEPADLVDADPAGIGGLSATELQRFYDAASQAEVDETTATGLSQLPNWVGELGRELARGQRLTGLARHPASVNSLAVSTRWGVILAARPSPAEPFSIVKRLTRTSVDVDEFAAGLSWVRTGVGGLSTDLLAFSAIPADNFGDPLVYLRSDVLDDGAIAGRTMIPGLLPTVAPYDLWNQETGSWGALFPGQNLVATRLEVGTFFLSSLGLAYRQDDDLPTRGASVSHLTFRPQLYDRRAQRWSRTSEGEV